MFAPGNHEHDRVLQTVLQTVPVGIGVVRNRILGWCNPRIEEILGYTAEELAGCSARILYPDDEEYERVAREKHPQVLAGGIGTVETRMRRKDGAVIDVMLSSAALEPGSLEGGLIYTVLDITEFKRAEAALREHMRAQATLYANLPGLAYRCLNDEHWTMEFLSDGCRELTGRPPEAFVGNAELAYADLIHPEDREPVWSEIQDALDAKRPFEIEYRIVLPDDRVKWVWERGRGILDGTGQIVALEGFIWDVTERKQLEGRALQASRMEAIGRLAGGVAHDFNNIMQVIHGYASLLQDDLRDGTVDPVHVREIRMAADRARKVVRQLLAFSRRQVLQTEVVDINALAENLLTLIGRMIGEDIELVFEAGQQIPPIQADGAQVEQVLLNLCLNARDAMPRGGRLAIGTRSVDLDADACENLPGATPGRHVQIEVCDSGEGMDRPTAARIFEPFFTTKEVGKGSGLGLATVYGVVRQHGGTIAVESEPGHGTTFRVYLPVAVAGSGTQPAAESPAGRR
jgi:PAS domain S-box-containing protein